MQIAVACVEDVRYADAGLLAETVDFAHHLRQSCAGDDAILHDVVRRDAAHGGESGLATFPYEGALGAGWRDANLRCPITAANFVYVGHEVLDFGGWAVEFHEQEGATVGIVCVDGGFGG